MTIAIKINSHKFVTVHTQLSLVEMNRLIIVINAEAEPSTRQLAGNGVNGVRQISVKIGFFYKIQHIVTKGFFHVTCMAGHINDNHLIVQRANGVGGIIAPISISMKRAS